MHLLLDFWRITILQLEKITCLGHHSRVCFLKLINIQSLQTWYICLKDRYLCISCCNLKLWIIADIANSVNKLQIINSRWHVVRWCCDEPLLLLKHPFKSFYLNLIERQEESYPIFDFFSYRHLNWVKWSIQERFYCLRSVQVKEKE